MKLEKQREVIEQVENETDPKMVGEKVVEQDDHVRSLEELGALMIYFGGTGFRRMDEISSHLSRELDGIHPTDPVENPPLNVYEQDFARAYKEKHDLARAFEEIQYGLEDFERLMSRDTSEEERRELWENRIPEGEEIDVFGFRELYEDVKILYQENLLPDLLAFEHQIDRWMKTDEFPSEQVGEEEYRNFVELSGYDQSEVNSVIDMDRVAEEAKNVVEKVYTQDSETRGFNSGY
ncbi:MAG: hypothetical protein R6V35_04640 [Candidatus Nanohaloarchaea archaeon]